ncbi:MAG: undecaprenyl-phosphate glucose phosphotransferase [Desulfobacteraceae bacterium]
MNEYLLIWLLRIFDALTSSLFLLFFCFVCTHQISFEGSVLLSSFSFIFSYLCLTSSNIYRSFRFTNLKLEIYKIFNGVILFAIGFSFLSYMAPFGLGLPRILFLLWIGCWSATVILCRIILRYFLRFLRKSGYGCKKVVIAGKNSTGEKLMNQFMKTDWAGINVVGFFDDNVSGSYRTVNVLGKISEMRDFVKKYKIDFVYIALPIYDYEKWRLIVNELSHTSTAVNIVADSFLYDVLLQSDAFYFGDTPFISVLKCPLSGFPGFAKNTFDKVIALILILLTAPLFLVIAYMVKKSSPGPIIFAQVRHGINGEKIVIYKFRTLYKCDSGKRFDQVRKGDPRVTKIGAFLRKTSLDELPQLWNVVKGEMSLVGPRPHPVAMNSKYAGIVPDYLRRHRVKPGITGYAQVNGFRGETSSNGDIQRRIEFDLRYIREWSFFLDIEILVKTIFVLFKTKNVY